MTRMLWVWVMAWWLVNAVTGDVVGRVEVDEQQRRFDIVVAGTRIATGSPRGLENTLELLFREKGWILGEVVRP